METVCETDSDLVAVLIAARAQTQKVNAELGAALVDRRSLRELSLIEGSPQIAKMQALINELRDQYAEALIAQGQAHLAEARVRWNVARSGAAAADTWIRLHRSWAEVGSPEAQVHCNRQSAFFDIEGDLEVARSLIRNARDVAAERAAQ